MNKTVLVTGCSSGIGKTVAYGLRDKGYSVYPTVRKPEDLQALLDDGFDALQLDYADEQSVKHCFESLMKKTNGELYAVFHNGAYGQPGAVEDLTRETLEKQFAANFFGWHQLTNLIIPVMRQQGYGRIILNSSVLGFVAMPMRGAYNASKFALEGLFDTLRLELNDTNIFISLIEPGPITSDFRKNAKIAFEENVYHNKLVIESSVYKEYYSKVLSRLAKEGNVDPFTLPATAVLKRVEHALNSSKPKIRYPVTFPTYLFGVLKRIFPSRLMDWLMLKLIK